MRRKKNIIDDIALRMRFEEVTDDEIITLISENVQDLEMGDCTGRTLLWHATFLNRRKVVEWLIGRGANINTQDENGFSALHIATQEKHIELVSYLLQNGANVNIQDKFGNTPLMRTDRATPTELLRILLENGTDLGVFFVLPEAEDNRNSLKEEFDERYAEEYPRILVCMDL